MNEKIHFCVLEMYLHSPHTSHKIYGLRSNFGLLHPNLIRITSIVKLGVKRLKLGLKITIYDLALNTTIQASVHTCQKVQFIHYFTI